MDKKMEEMFELIESSLKKAESPIIARRKRKLMQDAGLPASQRRKLKSKNTVEKEELEDGKLAKNEYEFTAFGNGDFKMEFGEEVPELVKKRAMQWAKKRGFKAKEASLEKSVGGTTWIVFAK